MVAADSDRRDACGRIDFPLPVRPQRSRERRAVLHAVISPNDMREFESGTRAHYRDESDLHPCRTCAGIAPRGREADPGSPGLLGADRDPSRGRPSRGRRGAGTLKCAFRGGRGRAPRGVPRPDRVAAATMARPRQTRIARNRHHSGGFGGRPPHLRGKKRVEGRGVEPAAASRSPGLQHRDRAGSKPGPHDPRASTGDRRPDPALCAAGRSPLVLHAYGNAQSTPAGHRLAAAAIPG